MMTKTHISIGLAAGFLAAGSLEIQPGIQYLGAIMIGSILPDIDHPGGKINQKILPNAKGADKLAVYIVMAFLAGYIHMKSSSIEFLIYTVPVLVIVAFSKHRGITHSILGAAIFIFSMYKIARELGEAFFVFPFAIGYVMHLVADMFTSAGIQLMYPSQSRMKFIAGIKTNGAFEKIILCVSTLIWIYMLYKIYF